MRFVVVGAGAIGGVVGVRLGQHGFDVVLVARGRQADVIARHGLTLRTPHETVTVTLPVVTSVSDLAWAAGDVALVAVKSQATVGVLGEIAAVAPPRTPIVCLQNGVENERSALRCFPNVYGVLVLCPAGYLEPGTVEAYAVRTTGILDVGRYPFGSDDVAREVSAAFAASGFVSRVRQDIMRWKWNKLIASLGNAVEALCEPGPGVARLTRQARKEGWTVFAAAGVTAASRAEDAANRGDLLELGDIGIVPRAGGSTWQSLARGTGDVETDYLTGEIVLLGRRHGVATPLNEVLQRLARRMAVERRPPGTFTEEQVLAELKQAWRP
ncbi:MAG TPA: 2-dehydropantoate 2-reductase N-terminal domain-containing protein [Kineosporiaceae bacterium]